MDIDLVLAELGRELTMRREARGWTRLDMVRHLEETQDVTISDSTLFTYEHGKRQLSVPRYLQLTESLRVSAPGMLTTALYRADHARCKKCGGAQ